MTDSAPVIVAGWTLALGEAAGAASADEFRAIYRGEDFGAPRRGLLAVLARGDGEGRVPAEAAEVAARLVAEGYFGALATLSPKAAAARALSAANDWMFRQSRNDPQRRGMAASLCALAAPASRKLAIVHLGENRVYLLRSGRLQPLTRDHLRPRASGPDAPTRALGFDREVQADVVEIDALPGDRVILLGAGLSRGVSPERLGDLLRELGGAGETAQKLVAAAPRGAAAIIDVIEVSSPQRDDFAAEYAALPIRPPPHDGETLDGFVVGRTIYRGQYTLLKRARDTIGDRDVVLKFPLLGMAQDPVFQAGFLREAWIGARLRSRWTVDYLDLPAERRSCLYLVMPYYHGETLDARLRTAPPVSLAEGAGIAISLCEAVEDLARRHVVHRDLKPENIFLLRSGEVKLLDLGLAALPGLDESGREDLGGTTRYMAPELFRGASPGLRSEVFSLGVTLYRMFSGGAFPFGAREAFPLARARPDLPDWLGKIIGQAIEVEPERRFADATALRAALEHGLFHQDWRGRPPRPPGARMPWRALAAGLALLCLALLLWRR
ncbi:bifunctional serine/threonine-protein phosphatase/kinase [Rhodoblastus acidophilus]|uniref:Bifunctional serine/threonine-protein phosphatase/kinase n=1 Tax=Candidatus Rhodoblastus alkanivorans TaxID=2954117 RepID=A0ABS9Z266_9HYPH|nr:bifunctional protein-serine/threonine kinase/phosphatase [Candidatus Rhodoblastus alkanivorans]MCI4679017.1 bifunctional serine/threonine-protein phosphatase/kinase [Candidatus Rhodoblastus alkanivorans]MCI4681728.1 bifunctional serine/threonine-protein phosphatase/kinase [Candidatus Rhodoblastus alkanivorans]MDI4642777.1 bifunctional serine/threonine-protein phosphatase/kinase [Rhodoblastus acidophilus]